MNRSGQELSIGAYNSSIRVLDAEEAKFCHCEIFGGRFHLFMLGSFSE